MIKQCIYILMRMKKPLDLKKKKKKALRKSQCFHYRVLTVRSNFNVHKLLNAIKHFVQISFEKEAENSCYCSYKDEEKFSISLITELAGVSGLISTFLDFPLPASLCPLRTSLNWVTAAQQSSDRLLGSPWIKQDQLSISRSH